MVIIFIVVLHSKTNLPPIKVKQTLYSCQCFRTAILSAPNCLILHCWTMYHIKFFLSGGMDNCKMSMNVCIKYDCLKYNIQEGLFYLCDFTLTQFENLYHFSNLCDNVHFNTIWRRW